MLGTVMFRVSCLEVHNRRCKMNNPKFQIGGAGGGAERDKR